MEDLTRYLSAWRVLRSGSREIIDGLVAEPFRETADLAGLLHRWPGKWYWADRDKTQIVLVRALPGARRPRWMLHLVLFALTVLCSLGAGAALAGAWYPPAAGSVGEVLAGVLRFFLDLGGGGWRQLLSGWTFAVPLLGILLVHESGHYVTARRYELDSSPPYFLPIPPNLSPIGSLGAFIRLRSVVLDRRQLLDVGAAGPLAGFTVALAVLAWGYLTSDATAAPPAALHFGALTRSWVEFAGEPIGLGDSLLTGLFRRAVFGDAAVVHLSLPAFAGWVGAFVTGLNLLPLSQLDGGHVLYGLLGTRQRSVALVAVAGLLFLAQWSSTWLVWVAMTFLIGGGRWSHPAVAVLERAVPASRRWVGAACVVVFALSFVPLPFSL